ncbi:MAG: hypothetical protein CMD23_01140 [Flavobacteriales bacterium]|nr:hypothetical protein [Flavobacteriales bacterium]
MAKKIYKDGKYTGQEILTEEEHRRRQSSERWSAEYAEKKEKELRKKISDLRKEAANLGLENAIKKQENTEAKKTELTLTAYRKFLKKYPDESEVIWLQKIIQNHQNKLRKKKDYAEAKKLGITVHEYRNQQFKKAVWGMLKLLFWVGLFVCLMLYLID